MAFQSVSVRLLELKLEMSITSVNFGATAITVHGFDIICLLSLAPLMAYTVEKRTVPVFRLLTIAAPLVFIPNDLMGTTSHKVLAVPTHQSYFSMPLSRSSNSSQLEVKYSSKHLNVMEGPLALFADELETSACNREAFKSVLFPGDGEERVLSSFCMGGVKSIRTPPLVFSVDRPIAFVPRTIA